MDLSVTWVEIYIVNQVWTPMVWVIVAALSLIVLMTAMPTRRRQTSTPSADGTASPTATARPGEGQSEEHRKNPARH